MKYVVRYDDYKLFAGLFIVGEEEFPYPSEGNIPPKTWKTKKAAQRMCDRLTNIYHPVVEEFEEE